MTTPVGNLNPNLPYGHSFSEALAFWWREQLKDLYTAMPGVIVDYNGGTRRATVLPALDMIAADGEVYQRPLIGNVPVLTPGGGGYTLLLPLKQGDPVLLLFAMRGIAHWKRHHTAGLPIRSEHPTRGHLLDINDAIAVPAFGPAGVLPGDYPDGVTFARTKEPEGALYLGRQLAEGDDALHILVEDGAVRVRAQNGEIELDAGNGAAVTLTLAAAGVTATVGDNSLTVAPAGVTATVGGATLTVTGSEASYTDGSDTLALLAHKRAYDAHIAAYGSHTHSTPAGQSGGPS